MPLTVLLIRHAQSAVQHDRLAGWLPGVGLSELGRSQAKALGERMRDVPLAAVYSSPLERCRLTAQAVLDGRSKPELKVLEDLGEVRYGSWEGKTYKVLMKTELWKLVQSFPSQVTFPGGESIRDLQARAVQAVESIRAAHRSGVVAVFSHADTIRCVVAHYAGMHLDMFQRVLVSNASVTAIAFGMGPPRLVRMSDTGDYSDLVPPRRKRKP